MCKIITQNLSQGPSLYFTCRSPSQVDNILYSWIGAIPGELNMDNMPALSFPLGTIKFTSDDGCGSVDPEMRTIWANWRATRRNWCRTDFD